MIITNYACLLRSDSSLKLKHLVISTPETQDIVSSVAEYQMLYFSHQTLREPNQLTHRHTHTKSMQTHTQFDSVE
jgi:hypothetical protein